MTLISRYFARLFRFISRFCPFGTIKMFWPAFGNRPDHYLAYVLVCLFIDVAGLCLICNLDSGATLLPIAVVDSFIRLADLPMAFMRPFYADPYPHMPERRRLLLILINLAETVILFASLLLVWGTAWDPQIDRAAEALYHSAVTLSTLGFGDIIPLRGPYGDPARVLTMSELGFSVVFIAFGFSILSGGLQRDTPPAVTNSLDGTHNARKSH